MMEVDLPVTSSVGNVPGPGPGSIRKNIGENKPMFEDKRKPNIREGTPCMPGQKLCIANEYFEAGEGAYEFGNTIYSAILGWLSIKEFPEQELTVISVERRDGKRPFTSPRIGAIVTCTVIFRMPKLCRVLITHVGSVKLDDTIKGIIRREYITDKHRDSAEIATSFGLGDTVIARIVGVGDGDFIMSTAEDSLGVSTALSKAGYYMIPIGWTMMQCPKTKETEPRKIAKIIQDQNVENWHTMSLNKEANKKPSSDKGKNSSTSTSSTTEASDVSD